uniref:Aa_trans domain-containing protein n=1 Tax=Parastrongyloides trichosuri TaxID=131310 RepID=A0A0N4ZMP1_PARTI
MSWSNWDIPKTGKKLQEWTNKNVFTESFDIGYHQQQQRNDPFNAWDQGVAGETIKEESPPEESNYGSIGEQPNNKIVNYQDSNPGDFQIESINEETDPHGGGQPITALQAAWNVTNAIQGMFIVGLPVAVKVGGWWTIFFLIGAAYICYVTGILLIDCLYEKNVKVRKSYKEVADTVRPGLGNWVLSAQLLELASTCILYLVLAGDLLQGCVPSVDKSAWMMIVSAALLGTAFVDDIRKVSDLSFLNGISHLIINGVMLIYCLSEFSSWNFSSLTFFPRIRSMPTMIGVVVFGYTSHIFLPSLEGSMIKPTEFRWMLKWSHIAAAIFKATFGLIGFLTFGEYTQKEISNSLPNQTFKILINLILVVKALLSYPLPFYAIVQLIMERFFNKNNKSVFRSCFGADGSLREWALCLRIILVLFTLTVSLSVPYLIEVMGLIGNITGTMLSFIWPAYFHLIIKQKEGTLKESEKKFDKFVIGFGIFLMIVGIQYSFLELLNEIKANREIDY